MFEEVVHKCPAVDHQPICEITHPTAQHPRQFQILERCFVVLAFQQFRGALCYDTDWVPDFGQPERIRVIMKLMRHSSLELTVKRYTDEAGLASNDAVNRLPFFRPTASALIQIRTHISDKRGQNMSRSGETTKGNLVATCCK
jgi:hypothetical protein